VIIYGVHSVLSFIKHRPELIRKVYVSENFNLEKIKYSTIKLFKTTSKEISLLSKSNEHQGICAELQYFPYTEVEFEKTETVCILDHIEDPRNLGAIMRNALAYNVDVIIIPKERACEITPATIKASAGAAAILSVMKVGNINHTIQELKNSSFWVYGFEANGNTKLSDVKFDRKAVLVLGSEGKGLSSLTRKNCDFVVSIEMNEKASSLNVSSSSAIVFYQRYIQGIGK